LRVGILLRLRSGSLTCSSRAATAAVSTGFPNAPALRAQGGFCWIPTEVMQMNLSELPPAPRDPKTGRFTGGHGKEYNLALLQRANSTPLCGARRKNGEPCRKKACWSWRTKRFTRCQRHGGRSTGSRKQNDKLRECKELAAMSRMAIRALSPVLERLASEL